MDSLFELSGGPNYKMAVENARKYGVGPRIPTVIATSIGFLFIILYSAASGILEKCWIFYTVVIAILVITFFLPNILVSLGWRKLRKQNGGALPQYTITIADQIIVKSGELEVVYEFQDLTEVVHLKYSYKLRFTGRGTMLLDIDRFTKGTFSEFKQFLRTKRPDLKIPE